MARERIGAGRATVDPKNAHSEESSDNKSSRNLEFGDKLLDTPTLEDVKKKFSGSKIKFLAPLIASLPIDMTDTISKNAKEMLKLLDRINQKKEARLKLDSTTDEGKSYIPGSLRSKNPISGPNYLKGNERIEQIVQEGHDANEQYKLEQAKIVKHMAEAVEKEVRLELHLKSES